MWQASIASMPASRICCKSNGEVDHLHAPIGARRGEASMLLFATCAVRCGVLLLVNGAATARCYSMCVCVAKYACGVASVKSDVAIRGVDVVVVKCVVSQL